MKTIYSEFKQLCMDKCSTSEIGIAIFKFYKDHIFFTPSQKAQAGKDVRKARTIHFLNLLAEFDEISIINIINYFIEKINKGEVIEIQSAYFYSCVKNNYLENNKQTKVVKKEKLIPTNKPILAIKILKPIIVRQIIKNIDETKQLEEHFLYRCPECQNLIHGKVNECNGCNNVLDYTAIDYNGVIL